MKKIIVKSLLFTCAFLPVVSCTNQPSAIIETDKETLMNEVRADVSPLNGSNALMNPPRFMWPDKFPHLGPVLDGVAGHVEVKPEALYRIRISQDKNFKKNVITGEKPWAFFNPFTKLEKGEWFWQYAYVDKEGKEEWSPVYQFFINDESLDFNPPAYDKMIAGYTKQRPRVLLDVNQWDAIVERNKDNADAKRILKVADDCMKVPLKHLQAEIDTSYFHLLKNIVTLKSALIRESRKMVDREELYMNSLVRSYLLTKDKKYYREGIRRLTEVLSWKDNKYFAGDFNLSTLLSMSTIAYDGFYNELTADQKKLLLDNIQVLGDKFYHEYVNHLENRIADNHVWQMTFRILTMAAFATYGDIPEATVWTDYCYNQWVSRFPGLNDDGAWHNGDAYFNVNIRTLIEVPKFYSRITGFDFFADPWYNNSAYYVVYEQPPFSKSGGQGSSHEKQLTPHGGRVGYADALARECNNPWAAAYVHELVKENPDIYTEPYELKPADLSWYRCTTDKSLPAYTKTLADMPMCKVFNETGLAMMNTDLGHHNNNAMLTFRSSSYGSTSHAMANQNAFNTFYGGKAILYSSGHRTGFTDPHNIYAYRNTRAHNSILVNGMGQKIGTEGYGWIPRYYEGEEIGYVVGDASNAYGKVTSPLWLERGRLSDIQFTPENGWDENKLDFFRRHIVQLGRSGLFVIYDELEAKEAVEWNYLLHTIDQPMDINEVDGKSLQIAGKNNVGGISVAHLFAADKFDYNQTDKFFYPAVKIVNSKPVELKDHHHLTVTTNKNNVMRFLNVVDVHGANRENIEVKHEGNKVMAGDWVIECNLTTEGKAYLKVYNTVNHAMLDFNYDANKGATRLTDITKNGKVEKTLVDFMPIFEI